MQKIIKKKRFSNIVTVAQSRLLVCMYEKSIHAIDFRILSRVRFILHSSCSFTCRYCIRSTYTRYNICVYTIFQCVYRRFTRHCVAANSIIRDYAPLLIIDCESNRDYFIML